MYKPKENIPEGMADKIRPIFSILDMEDDEDTDDDEKESIIENTKELTGNFMLDRDGGDDGYIGEDGTFAFCFGPEENGYRGGEPLMSDLFSAYTWMQHVLECVKDEFAVKLQIGAAENYHIIQHPEMTVELANQVFLKIKEALTAALPEGVKINDISVIHTYK